MATRLDPAARRDQILAATLRLVARDGFARVTLRDVAAEVGVVHGLIRHYFPTREQLMAEAFDAAVLAELEGDEEVAERVEPVEALADWLTTTPRDHYFVWIDAWSEAHRNPELLAALTRHHRDCERRLARIIERLAESGRGASDDPAADAKMLTALVDGVAVQHHAIDLIGRAEADRVVYTAAEDRLGLERGTLAASRPTAARGQWAADASPVAATAGPRADRRD
ncbi:TetR family transcriptional regulator C-terminal domain-containing protein [Agromyces sp. H66]|uniref:TetR/AcrR family transcriptional regulator n=1 Tax=Agromyces sp. H66 TaxID=2529859 RepID=UPI0010A9A8BE|nr:TetR family transcriptional regulator C-terminal domain-containing protein [Agromyces sp. H66]